MSFSLFILQPLLNMETNFRFDNTNLTISKKKKKHTSYEYMIRANYYHRCILMQVQTCIIYMLILKIYVRQNKVRYILFLL